MSDAAAERELEAQRREQCFVEAGGEREFTPRFGDTLRGIWASNKNPQRDGFYVRTVRSTGRVNRGTFYELTDGKGNLWQYWKEDTVLITRAEKPEYYRAIIARLRNNDAARKYRTVEEYRAYVFGVETL